MIPVTAAVAAIAVAQEFDRRQLMLDAVPGTPLAQIGDCISFITSDIANSKEYIPDANLTSNQSNNWNNNPSGTDSEHTTSLNTLAIQIAGFVQTHLNFAKNTVRPLIEELVTNVKLDIEALPLSAEFSMEIVQSDLPEPMIETSFEDSIMEYKNVEFYAISTYLSLPPLTPPEIFELLITGHSGTDKAINTWAARLGDSFFQNIWDSVFTNAPTEKRFENLVSDNEYGADAAVAVYLLTSKLFDNPIEGTKQSLATYNKQIAELRQQAALRLVHAYEEYVRFKTTGLLIKNSTPNRVTVVGDNYRKWMEEGGNNAVIFGSILSSRPEKFAADISTNKADYMAAWERQNWMLTVAERNKRFVYYKEILKNRTMNLVADNFKQCFGHLNEGGVTDPNMAEFVQFQTCLVDLLPTLTENDFKNLWSLAQRVVCSTIFYYTDSGKILSGIEEACANNEGIEIREAALLSTITYVTDYVCDQMKLSSI